MSNNKSKIALIIPAYNESAAIEGVLSDVRNITKKYAVQLTIVVVDDGSTDDTARKISKHNVVLIKHVLNSGSGGATATGLAFAKKNGFNYAATIDADGQHDIRDLISGLDLIREGSADLLLGSRLLDTKGMSKVKVFGNKGLSRITHILFGVNVTDSQSGLRVLSSNAINNLHWKMNGYEFCSEMLWRAKQKNLIIKEFPIRAIYTDYSTSKGQNNWNAINIVKSLLQRRLMEIFGE